MINIATILKHNVIGKLLNHLVVFFINVLIVRLLGAGVSGLYFNELYLLNFIVFFFSAGLDYSAISILSRQPGLLQVINKMLLLVVMFFVIILVILVIFIFPAYPGYFNQPVLAIMLFSTGNLLLIFFQGILSALKKFNLQNLILGISNLMFFGYLLSFYFNGKTITLQHTALAYALLFFLQGITMFLFSYSTGTVIKGSIKWKKFITSGLYIMFSSLVYFAFLRIDNFFVQKYEDPTTLGNYVQCGKVGQYFLYFSSIISSTLLPFITSETIGASFLEWKKMMRPYVLLLCMAAFFIGISGNIIFPLIFGDSFRMMNKLMLILLPGFVCLGMLTLLNAVYIGKGSIRKIFLGDLLGLLFVTVFDALLVPRYGAYGAAVISSIAYCLVFLYLFSGFKDQFTLSAKPLTYH